MAGIVKIGKTREQRTDRTVRPPDPDRSRTAMDVWAPRIAAIISILLLFLAAWMLLLARPWAQ